MAKRYAKDNRPQLEKVRKIELPNKNLKQKLIIAGVLLLIGLSAIGYGLYNSLKIDPGFTQIEVASNYDKNNSKEFVLYSYVKNSADKKNLIRIYSNAQVEAFRLFNVYEEYEHNLFYINHHPNEVIEIDERLYKALKTASDYKYIYLGPIYQIYNGIFSCDLDGQIKEFLPDLNNDVRNMFDKLSQYILDDNCIYIEFFDNNCIKLNVSYEYNSYLTENQLDHILDFYYMNNACIMDYVCDDLIKNGYDKSIISSVEGYMRLLDDSLSNYNLLGMINGELTFAGTIDCKGPVSVIEIRNFIINESDKYNYYQTANKEIYSKYLDFYGNNIKGIDNLLTYSNDNSLKLILETMNLYFGKDSNIKNISIINNIINNNSDISIKDLNEQFIIQK